MFGDFACCDSRSNMRCPACTPSLATRLYPTVRNIPRPRGRHARVVVRAEGESDEPAHKAGDAWFKHLKSEFDPVSSAPPATAVLDFEKPLVELDRRIREVRQVAEENGVDVTEQIKELETRAIQLRQDTYSRLTPVQRLQVARHPSRPTFLDIAYNISDKFVELHGDRGGLDDAAVVCGLASIDGISFMMIGQQKGRNTKENILRNFAMPQPNGYRKALRFMQYADKFGMPILTFVDTPGAFAGRSAEELGQGEAIARNLREMFGIRVPIISVVIGEGGSGGALAIGCANRSLIMENAVYYVASPEACAAILWKSREETGIATDALRITAQDLIGFEVMDGVIDEPLGGAHRNPMGSFPFIKEAILKTFGEFEGKTEEQIKADRYAKFRKLGQFREYLVEGGDWKSADARREAAQGVTTKTGRWAEDEQEAAYWDIFDEMTEDWEDTLEANKEWLMPPKSMAPSPTRLPKSENFGSEAAPSEGDSDERAPVVKEVIGNNSV